MLSGRDFDDQDGAAGQTPALVNERYVRQFLPDRDPIGRHVTLTTSGSRPSTRLLTIVGIAPDVRHRPGPDAEAMVYVPFYAAPPADAALLVRSRLETAALVPLLRSEAHALDVGLPLYRLQTLAEVVRSAQWAGRVSHSLLLAITFIAVALATIGLYAVTAHGVSQRTHEIGIRTALGAQPRQVIALIVRRALAHLALGFVAGILCTITWDALFWSGRIGVRATDPLSLAAIAAPLAIAAMVACSIPARRAARLDPVAAIRGD